MKRKASNPLVLSVLVLLGTSAVSPAVQSSPSSATEAYPSQPAATGSGLASSSATAEVLKLARAGVSEDVILAYIQNSNRSYPLTASEIISLRKEGITDRMLTAMLNQRVAAPAVAFNAGSKPPPPTPQAPAVAQESMAPPASTAYVIPDSGAYSYSYPAYYPYYGGYYGGGYYPWVTVGYGGYYGYRYHSGCYPTPYYHYGYYGYPGRAYCSTSGFYHSHPAYPTYAPYGSGGFRWYSPSPYQHATYATGGYRPMGVAMGGARMTAGRVGGGHMGGHR